jgi:biotin-(acetyl-CoA carboxylase) ligase
MEAGGADEYASELAVAAPTYIAGQSTSSFALAWRLHADGLFPEWASVLCSCQTEGRGQLRRHWHSPRGNLHVTFRLPGHPVFQGEAASVATGYLMVAAFRLLGFPVALKWPNDVLLHGERKVGGILLEEKDGVIMAGLGVNIAEVPAERELRRDRAVGAAVLLPHHARAGVVGEDDEGEELPLAPFSLWRRLVTWAILEYSQRVVHGGVPYVAGVLNGAIPEPSFPFSFSSRAKNGLENRFAPEGARGNPFKALLAWQGRRVSLKDGEGTSGILLGVGPRGGALLGLDDGERRECFPGSPQLI